MPESNIGFYGHVKQYHNLKPAIDQAILDVLESGSYVLGPQLVKFEGELARYMKTKETVGVNSGTDALLLVFLALGLGPGDEVITTSNTFFATAEAIWLAGATPVFVDSDPRTRNIDVSKIEAAITSKTRAIVPVHLYGLTADMPAIARIAKAHNLFVVEDCAQGIGARGDTFAIGMGDCAEPGTFCRPEEKRNADWTLLNQGRITVGAVDSNRTYGGGDDRKLEKFVKNGK